MRGAAAKCSRGDGAGSCLRPHDQQPLLPQRLARPAASCRRAPCHDPARGPGALRAGCHRRPPPTRRQWRRWRRTRETGRPWRTRPGFPDAAWGSARRTVPGSVQLSDGSPTMLTTAVVITTLPPSASSGVDGPDIDRCDRSDGGQAGHRTGARHLLCRASGMHGAGAPGIRVRRFAWSVFRTPTRTVFHGVRGGWRALRARCPAAALSGP